MDLLLLLLTPVPAPSPAVLHDLGMIVHRGRTPEPGPRPGAAPVEPAIMDEGEDTHLFGTWSVHGDTFSVGVLVDRTVWRTISPPPGNIFPLPIRVSAAPCLGHTEAVRTSNIGPVVVTEGKLAFLTRVRSRDGLTRVGGGGKTLRKSTTKRLNCFFRGRVS